MVFSSRQINTPSRGVFSMHPFVDVLEGRSFLCATVHEGVFAVEALDATSAPRPAAAEATPAETDGLRAVEFDAGAARPGLLLSDGAPAHVVVGVGDDEGVFSTAPITGGDETLFANVFRDRRGAPAPLALPAPPITDLATSAQPATDAPPSTPFYGGRAMNGAMRPFISMTVPGRGAAFADVAIENSTLDGLPVAA